MYEIVTYSLFEIVVTSLEAKIKVTVPEINRDLINEFSDLAKVLLGLDENNLEWEQFAHIHRAGVTNNADRGLDMWTNFGPVVQVKHLTLNEKKAEGIVDQVESDHIVVVCKDADAKVLEIVATQISWGKRVRGIVKESQLVAWYEKCLRGEFSTRLATPPMEKLVTSFKAEFPQSLGVVSFFEERGYLDLQPEDFWLTDLEAELKHKTDSTPTTI